MITVVRDSADYTATLTLSADADQVASVYQVFATLSHEWGGEIVEDTVATRVSSGVYTITFDQSDLISSGIHKIHWRYVQTTTKTKDDFFNVYQPYISSSEFFNNHPELETDFDDSFKELERKCHNIIDTHCGQSFQPVYGQIISVDGQDNRGLYFNHLLNTLTTFEIVDSQLTTNDTTDYTTYVEISPENKRVLRWKNPRSKFSSDLYYQILGDWGWQYVPMNITQAADLILVDLMSSDSIYRQHGIERYMFDRGSEAQFNMDYLVGSTGNLDADVLLMDYTIFLMNWI